MGLSLSQIDHEWIANQRVVTVEATFDTNYQNETGEFFNETTLANNGIDLGTIEHVDIVEGATNKGYVPRWNKSDDRLHAFEAGADGGPLDEVTGGKDDLANETIQLRVWGRS